MVFFLLSFFFSFYFQHSLPVHMHMVYTYFASFGAGCVHFTWQPLLHVSDLHGEYRLVI
jgi:hypothetical protein